MARQTRYLALIWLSLIASLLAACATSPSIDETRYLRSPAPTAVTLPADRGARVLWGGTIIATRNLAKGSQLEVLAFPLDSSQYPQVSANDLGRFLLQTSQFIDPAVYTPGRLVTIAGVISGTAEGKLGEATYRYPIVQAEQLHLWARGDGTDTHFMFGIGIRLGH